MRIQWPWRTIRKQKETIECLRNRLAKAEKGADVFAADKGKGLGLAPDDPCSTTGAFAITNFLGALYPERKYRIIFLGDPDEESVVTKENSDVDESPKE